jgi:hypothetical protein
MKRLVFFSIFLFCLTGTYAQTVITGKVVDSESGTPVPCATISLAADYSGTVTNSDGGFALRPRKFPPEIVLMR